MALGSRSSAFTPWRIESSRPSSVSAAPSGSSRPEWPEPRRNPARIFRLLGRRPMDSSVEEIQTNPRARSAKLRVVERI